MVYISPPHLYQDITLRIWWATRWRVAPGWRHSRPFRKPFTNVWYVLQGSMGVRIDDEEIRAGAGTLMVVPPGVRLDNWNAGPERLDYLSLGFECILGGVDIFHGRDPEIRQVRLSRRALALWRALERETEAILENDNALEPNLRLAGYARLWWSETVKHVGAGALARAAAMDPRVGQALDWVRANLHAHVRASDVARMLHVSESYLRQLFVSSLGISFRSAITDLRLQRAKLLLMTTTMTVGEIARAVGFADPHYFTRVFTRFEGASPRAFRRAARREA